MVLNSTNMILGGVVVLSILSYGYYKSQKLIEENGFNSRDLINIGANNDTLWLYYDHSEVNGRLWSDFGTRSSRVLNVPFLNLCYQSIVMNNGRTYTVKVLSGLSDVAILLGGWASLPKSLQNPIAPVNEAELNYIRATILRRFGGLWVNPSTIFLKPLLELKESKKVVFFGTDKDESYSDIDGTPVPGTDVMYSPNKENPIFVELEALALKRIIEQQGGKQFRKDIKWDLKSIMDDFSKEIEYIPTIEFARKENGRRIQLEDLLSSSEIPIPKSAIYVPIDWNEIRERQHFGWFLRMSEDQILESNLFISKLIKFNGVATA